MESTNFLEMIHSPSDLRLLNRHQLILLARELRGRIINTVSKTGGHLAPSLGVVELTIALHYVFDSPQDKIVWDVGHQSYAHKLLTGRKHKFHTLRQYKGISGFPKREESEHDAFNTGHSSTSISAALGIAKARDLKKESHKVIAVTGDGALTGGMAFEGLNQAGHLKSDLLVILNDNRMSISPNVGALSKYLRKIVTSPKYHDYRKKIVALLKKLPSGDKAAEKAVNFEDTIRAFSSAGMFFNELGFKYYGPIGGHNLDDLIKALRNIQYIKGPVLLHVITKKGKGYAYAEQDKTKFHGIGSFNIENGEKNGRSAKISYTNAFSNCLVKLAKEDKRVIAITAAMASGTGLDDFAEKFPDRFFDVGIAEQHAVTFAAGLALNGFKPVCAIYSTFLQRAYDQIIHDVCLQNLNVTFAIDRAGIVGEDGPTHHGCFDLSYLRHIPNMTVMAPKDEDELGHMLKTAINNNGPAALRYPRGEGIGVKMHNPFKLLKVGKAEIMKEGEDLAIFAVGPLAYDALNAAKAVKEFDVAVINPRFIKPLDEKMIVELAERTGKIITVEENVLDGGFGSAVLELLERNGISADVKRMGIPDRFIEHGDCEILKKNIGLTTEGIAASIRKIMKK